MSNQTVLDNLRRQEYLTPVQEMFAKKMWVEKEMFDPRKSTEYKGENKFVIPCQTKMPETVMAGIGVTQEPAVVTGSEYEGPWDEICEYIVLLEINQDLKALLGEEHPNAAHINAFKREMEGVIRVAGLDFEHILMCGGSTGAMGVVTAVDNVGKKLSFVSNRPIRDGMTLDFFRGTGTKTGSQCYVDYKDINNEVSVTFGSTANLGSIQAGDVAYKSNVHASTVTAKLPNSFLDLVKATGSIHNTPLATNPWFSAVQMANGGAKRKLELNLITTAATRVRNLGEEVPDRAMCESDIYNALSQRFKDENTPTVSMSAKDGVPGGLKYAFLEYETTFHSIPTFARNTIIGVTLSNFYKYLNGKDNWMRFGEGTNGGTILQKVSGYLLERAYYRMFRQYANTRPRASFRIDDLKGLSEE